MTIATRTEKVIDATDEQLTALVLQAAVAGGSILAQHPR